MPGSPDSEMSESTGPSQGTCGGGPPGSRHFSSSIQGIVYAGSSPKWSLSPGGDIGVESCKMKRSQGKGAAFAESQETGIMSP